MNWFTLLCFSRNGPSSSACMFVDVGQRKDMHNLLGTEEIVGVCIKEDVCCAGYLLAIN